MAQQISLSVILANLGISLPAPGSELRIWDMVPANYAPNPNWNHGFFVGHPDGSTITLNPGDDPTSILFQFGTDGEQFQWIFGVSGGLSHSGYILPTSLPPSVSFDHLINSVNEGSVASYTLTRSFVQIGDTGSAVHIHFSTSPTMTALPGVNYIAQLAPLSGTTLVDNGGNDWTLTFGAGSKTAGFTVKTIDDHVIPVANPLFELYLDNPTHATIAIGTIDTTVVNIDQPGITSVSTSPGSGSVVGAGQHVAIDLNFTDAVTVTGAPALALSDGGIATYVSGSGSKTLEFDYQVKAGQNTPDLTVKSVTLPAGASVKDMTGNVISLTGAAKADLQLVVDTIAPIVKDALKSDTGISATDKFTTDATLTGSGDPNATVNFTGDVVGNTVANSAGVWTFSPGVLADGAHSITATETDAAGNVGSTTLQFTLDSKAPTVTGSLASPTSIGTGGTATITVNLGEAISVVGTPTLILSDGETATYSAAASKLAAGALAFTLKAAAGTNQSDLSIDHVNLAAGVTVKDLAGNAADFSKAAGADLSLSIDTVAPTITSVTTPSTGAVGIGQTVVINVAASEAVTVVGTPTLTLNDKGIATYDAINSTATDLKFNYTPTVGQNTVDLQVSALVLGKGSTIKDLAGNLLNPAGAAKADLGLVVDTLAPAVTKVAVLPASGALTAGNDVTITLTLNDKATVTSNPVLTLNDGATADYVSGSGSNTLVFNYHVGSESTTDLKITGINQSGGTIADAVGNLISSALLFDTKLTANVFTWTHTAAPGGDWNTGANWLPASVPVAGNTALITSKGTYTVTSAQNNSIGTLSLTNKTATLDVQGFEFDITGSSTNAGTIQIDNGAKLGLAGTFTNTGSVLLNSTGSATGLLISGATILAGTGKFTLSDNIGNGIFADGSPATLTNISNTIAGAGQIFDNDLSIDNQAKGIINAVGTSSLTIDVDTFTNAGTLKATGTGGLVIHDTTIANVGKGLVATLAANSHIDLDDADITGGTVTIFKNSSIDTINDHDSTISATKFTNAGAVMADHGDLTVTGAIANTGLLAAAHDSTLSFTGAVTGKGIAQISTGGTLEFQGASSALVTFLDGTGTLELDNATNSVAKFTGTVTGFANGTDIELGAIDFTTGNAQLSFNAGKLTVTDGTHSETLTFIGSYTLADFNAVNVGGHVDLLHV